MLGLSTRKYGQAIRQFTEAYGLEKSAVSEHFIEASRAKLKDMMESRLDKLRLCALLIDATPFEGQQMVAALGIGQDGRKMILGIRQGATENATVVGELLGDLVSRGLDFTEPRLYVLDGGKALTAAVKKYAGESAASVLGKSPVDKRNQRPRTETSDALLRLAIDQEVLGELRTLRLSIRAYQQGLDVGTHRFNGSPYPDDREEAIVSNIKDLLHKHGRPVLAFYGNEHVSKTLLHDGGPNQDAVFIPCNPPQSFPWAFSRRSPAGFSDCRRCDGLKWGSGPAAAG